VIARTVVLVVIWIALQGELSVGNVIGGAIVAIAISVMFPMRSRTTHRLHPVALSILGARLIGDLVASSWGVTRAVLAPAKDRIDPVVVDVQLSTRSRLVAAIVANSITLTPGTMTIDIESTAEGHRLSVHSLGPVDEAEFSRRMAALEQRVLAAFEPVGSDEPGSEEDADEEVVS
jgi:multicomponent Na+:H+ antiporter subunit E